MQLNKFKSGTQVILNFSSNVIGDSNDETNFLHELLTDTQVLRLCEPFANGSSANIKLSRTQLLKLVQLGGFLGRLLASLMKVGLRLMKNELTPLSKGVLSISGLTVVASARDAAIQKKICTDNLKQRNGWYHENS